MTTCYCGNKWDGGSCKCCGRTKLESGVATITKAVTYTAQVKDAIVKGVKSALNKVVKNSYLGGPLPDSTEMAKMRGCNIIYPKYNELFIDIDSQEDFEKFQRCFQALSNHVETVRKYWIVSVTPSPSGAPGHVHVRIEMESRAHLSAFERIAWQAILGSDNMRETLSIIRTINGEDKATLFFEKPNV